MATHDAFRWMLIALAAMQLAGCAAKHAPYPADWAPSPTTAPIAGANGKAECPDISGRYNNLGTLAPNTPQELCSSAMHIKYRMIGDWFCETTLSRNLASSDPAGVLIDVRQPDRDTLVIFSDFTTEPVELRRSKGDFDCTAQGLTRTLRAPTTSLGYDEGTENTATQIYNVFSSVTNAFLATGGVQTLRRTFARSADGSLVMHVERSTHGLMIGLPINYEYSTYVTWRPITPADSAADPAGDSVRELVRTATWLPYRKWLMAPPWLVAVGDREYGPRPVEVVPGSQWVEFYAFDARKPRYGALFNLEAGHTYQLADEPPQCTPAGEVDAPGSAVSLQWREVVVHDSVATRVVATHRLRMMCGAGVRRCTADEDCDSAERCSLYPGAGWGYCAGAAPP